jgi:hypothetical protein
VPLVPVTVIVAFPAGVLPLVVIVRVEVPEVVTDAGENEAAAPVGKPVAAKLTIPVKPFSAPIVTV